MIGIDNLSKLTITLGKIGTATADALADGKFGFTDLPDVAKVLMAIPSFLSIDFEALSKEIKDLDPNEKAILAGLFKDNFFIEDKEDTEEIIEEGVDFLFVGIAFIGHFLAKKSTKALPKAEDLMTV